MSGYMILLLPMVSQRRLESVYGQGLFQEPRPGWAWGILWTLLGISAVLLVGWLAAKWQEGASTTRTSPYRLFRRVTARLGLSWPDRSRLMRLARGAGVEHPVALLLSARLYEEAVTKYCAGKSWLGSRAGEANEYQALRQRLFG